MKRYLVFEDTDPTKIGTLVFETDDFIEAITQAQKIAKEKVNRVFVIPSGVNSSTCITFDPEGRRVEC